MLPWRPGGRGKTDERARITISHESFHEVVLLFLQVVFSTQLVTSRQPITLVLLLLCYASSPIVTDPGSACGANPVHNFLIPLFSTVTVATGYCVGCPKPS